MFTTITKQTIFSIVLTLALVAFGTSFAFADEIVITPENTFELCTDGLDNDDDTTIDAGDADCIGHLTEDPEEELISETIATENSFELCTDGLDNDDDTTIDAGDADCIGHLTEDPEEEFALAAENTYELCTDGLDNDDDTTIDAGDFDCIGHLEAPVKEEPRRRSSGGSRKVPVANLSSAGEVLGASTDAGSCSVLTTYMKRGNMNNVEEVKMLQTFLSANMNADLPITGFFGPLTEQAVKNFQLKYKTEILKPWVDLGLLPSVDIATGYVYKTTLFVINKMLCADATQVMPVLN
jgi:hypothetical protein